jgi:hypothetical protein
MSWHDAMEDSGGGAKLAFLDAQLASSVTVADVDDAAAVDEDARKTHAAPACANGWVQDHGVASRLGQDSRRVTAIKGDGML